MRAALLLIALVACNPPDRGPRWRAAGASTPRRGGTLTIAVKAGASNLDPSIVFDEVSSYAMHPLFDTLVDYAPASTEVVPRLAERWEISPDGTTFRFTLRPGITYSDGRPIVAADFKYSLERALTTQDSPFGVYLADVEGAAEVLAGKAKDCVGITAPSERELVIHLARPNVAFLYILTMTFSTPQRADHVGAARDQLRRQPLGSGPYVLAAWAEGEKLVLRRNPHYFDPARGLLDEIVIYENLPPDTQFLMFERGELDTVERLAAPDYLWLTDQEAWRPYVHTRALMNAYGSRMNVRQKPFTDRRVRQAMNYALDKAHTTKLLNGGSVPSHGMLAPGLFGRDDSIPPYPHDPAKARALLAEAGYPNGFDVAYMTTSDEEAEKLAASLQGDLAEVGVRMHITLTSFATYITALGKPDGPSLALATWIGDYPDPTSFFDVRFHSRMIAEDSSNNDSFYANPELDALLDAARGETDAGERAAMYHRAERILYDDAPWIWDYHRLMTEVVQPYVRGYEPHPVWIRDYTTAWLDLGPDGERVPQ
jgi:ABC-type transport system substrate-binding protein